MASVSRRAKLPGTEHESRSTWWSRVLVACVLGLLFLAGVPAGGAEVGGLEMTTPVKQNIKLLQDRWGEWKSAHMQNNREGSQAALEQLLATVEALGMKRAPEYAVTAAALAARSAREGNVERARWTLDAARQLDDERPEIDFAAAAVERADGNLGGAVGAMISGYGKLANLPLEGRIWKQNLGIWGVYLVLLSAAVFVALQMRSYGAALIYDLSRLASPPLPPAGAAAAVIVVLLVPAVLPSGVLWMCLLWSTLLWGYGTLSQRGVLIVLWVAIGLIPMATTHQQREIEKSMLPSTRLVENLRAGRLYGDMFLDLEMLRGQIEDENLLNEIQADIHRHLGQWEHARVLYRGLVDLDSADTSVASVMNNLGIYFYYKEDWGTAVTWFKEANELNPSLVEGYYNLAQAHGALFDFASQHEAMAAANSLDAAQVARWESMSSEGASAVIPIDGGLTRFERTITVPETKSSTGLSLIAVLVAGALAMGLHMMRKKTGYPSGNLRQPPAVGSRWAMMLVPGWASTLQGNGPLALLGILPPMGILLIPLIPVWGYRVPLGYDPGQGLLTAICGAALILLIVVRGVIARFVG